MPPTAYDEFAYFEDNAVEVGLPYDGPPTVERVTVPLDTGRSLSALRWGDGPPELVLLHGGAQNAHTWDTVALALDRPLLAVDLPGHGHSDHRPDKAYWPEENARAVAVAVRELAPEARAVVGMSLGGLTALALAGNEPSLVRGLVTVDVTPGVDKDKASAITAFIAGPETFATFDEILERTVLFNPTRTESSLRRGILHNAHELPDGSWAWRYDRFHLDEGQEVPEFGSLWNIYDGLTMPFMLVRGADSPVVDDADVAEVRRRLPSARVEVVPAAGHSIQGDHPLALAALLQEFVPES
ncbi:MAG TPA: alpha/beta hydrolase [Acidimicrobiia bacterium]|jgi:pimeloyl-ACP methyl ester carboxylesterase